MKLFQLAALSAAVLALSACSSGVRVGDDNARGPVTGSAGGANSANASKQLQRCDKPVGTIGVIEDTELDWYRILTTQYKLPATTPLIRLMIQQSNCFIVVDRGRGLNASMAERNLRDSGEMRKNSNFGKGQLVSADYSLTPSINFSQQTGGGGAGALLGMFSPVAGALAGSFKTSAAGTTLILVDNRSGVQVAIAEGAATNTDFAFFGALGARNGGGAAGAYQATPEGKIIAGAFMDAYNGIVTSVISYAPQAMGNGKGLGTGGALSVDGQQEEVAPKAPARRTSKKKAPANK